MNMIYTDLITNTPQGPLCLTVDMEEEDLERLITLFRAKDIKVEDDREGRRLRREEAILEEEKYGILRAGDMVKVIKYSMKKKIAYDKARQVLLDSGKIKFR